MALGQAEELSNVIEREIRIAVIGSRGRMGRALLHLIQGEFASSCVLQAAIHSQSSDSEWNQALGADVWIDFSLAHGTPQLASKLQLTATAPSRPAWVVGTTGHSASEKKLLEQASGQTRVLHSSNFSPGVLALKKALEFISPTLGRSGFRPLLVETHHIHKKDSPSGTALLLASATDGMTQERIHSIRAGEVIGDHRIEFHGPGETLTLQHHAQTREVFARGALAAALWLGKKQQSDPRGSGWITLDDYFEERISCLK